MAGRGEKDFFFVGVGGFFSLGCGGGGGGGTLDDSLCLDDVEITHIPDMLPSLFPSWSG